MGAIVLTFTGVLAFLVLQNRSDRQTAVSEVMEPQDKRGGPYDSGLTGEGRRVQFDHGANIQFQRCVLECRNVVEHCCTRTAAAE